MITVVCDGGNTVVASDNEELVPVGTSFDSPVLSTLGAGRPHLVSVSPTTLRPMQHMVYETAMELYGVSADQPYASALAEYIVARDTEQEARQRLYEKQLANSDDIQAQIDEQALALAELAAIVAGEE